MVTLSRADAGRRLAMGLAPVVCVPPVVVALTPGGVRVASEVARAFEAPLDVLPVRRLDVAGRLHATFGAVAEGTTLILGDRVRALGLPDDYVSAMAELAHRAVEAEAHAWRGGAPPVLLEGRTVILADDGLSDPVSIAAATRALRALNVAHLVYAAPSVNLSLAKVVTAECDHCHLLYEAEAPIAAFVCDSDFSQTTRFDVRSMVRRSRPGFSAPVGP